MAQMEIQEAGRAGAQMIEVRLDFLAKAPDFKRLLDNKPCPLLCTVRRAQDGGRWNGDEAARLVLLRQAIVSGFDWVDLETDVADQIRRFKDVKRIVSYHNINEVPADLGDIYKAMCAQDADVVKIAVRAQRADDSLRVLDLLKGAPKPTVALCMGELGFASRILSAKFGAPFTYAAFNKERMGSLGIPSFDDLRSLYRYETIGPDTAVYGVIGDPIGHSLSPTIHNRAFQSLNIDAVYLPFRVPAEELANFIAAFERVPVQGYSVTIPHKEEAAALAIKKDPDVELTRAANTLLRIENGFHAANTDFQASIDSLLAKLPPTEEGKPGNVQDRTVLILGAGGVARAIAHALRKHGALLTITNRNPGRAQLLAADTQARTIDWPARHTAICDFVVNCTPVGMHPNVDDTPIHPSCLKQGMTVFDSIYTPENTLLIKEARERGCHVVTGVDMFVRQAALQFQRFTGREAPIELMETVVRRALSPVKELSQ
jgi:3-dehydroquinate dehydratase/shikimate dehydrogenase